jgi:hypothetical protein
MSQFHFMFFIEGVLNINDTNNAVQKYSRVLIYLYLYFIHELKKVGTEINP